MNCGTSNWTPKTKCSKCGLKKSWAQIVQTPPRDTTSAPVNADASAHVQGNPVRAKLAAVANTLVRLSEEGLAAATSPASATPSGTTLTSKKENGEGQSKGLRQETKARISKLEAAHAALPQDDPEYKEERD